MPDNNEFFQAGFDKKFRFWRNHSEPLTLLGALPPPLGTPTWDNVVFPVTRPGPSCCAPSPDGGMMAQEGDIMSREKEFQQSQNFKSKSIGTECFSTMIIARIKFFQPEFGCKSPSGAIQKPTPVSPGIPETIPRQFPAQRPAAPGRGGSPVQSPAAGGT